MSVVGWLDPSLSSFNKGDSVISDAVERELVECFPESEIVRLPTQVLPNLRQRRLLRSADCFIVGGTNILNGNVPWYLQWKLAPRVVRRISGRTTLLGVGWWQYQNQTNGVSARLWRTLLRGKRHSVRDSYTVQKLETLGIDAVNTACPTMWRLPGQVNRGPRRSKVLSTVTDYHAVPKRDRRMLLWLRQNYDEVTVWCQGRGDHEYVRSLGVPVELLRGPLAAYDRRLRSQEYDYFGTRLHAGIRALEADARAHILLVDNRAAEIAADTGLPVVREDCDWATSFELRGTRLALPLSRIQEFRDQLRESAV